MPAVATRVKNKLSETDVRLIKFLLIRGATGAELAREFKVTDALISHIKMGRIYRDIPSEL
jgi:hypothetical protein